MGVIIFLFCIIAAIIFIPMWLIDVMEKGSHKKCYKIGVFGVLFGHSYKKPDEKTDEIIKEPVLKSTISRLALIINIVNTVLIIIFIMLVVLEFNSIGKTLESVCFLYMSGYIGFMFIVFGVFIIAVACVTRKEKPIKPIKPNFLFEASKDIMLDVKDTDEKKKTATQKKLEKDVQKSLKPNLSFEASEDIMLDPKEVDEANKIDQSDDSNINQPK